MYQKFNDLITIFSNTRWASDYWSDVVVVEAEEILSQFSENDWEVLQKNLSLKPLFWQQRLVECLGYQQNSHELQVILQLLVGTDDDLSIACIDALRSIDVTNLDVCVKDKLIAKIHALSRISSLPVKLILADFSAKLYHAK
ncbi:hypothetical protein N5853_08295 [Bartonella sp. HY329]|uniref:hypothetical protein n=1 Tax=unclassified Bartonella TaxID=2645622 RepID=UPI0021C6E623|nr:MULTISPECIES: hypothetical protein [unclassified Bartonella]UXM94117.1 hypothetical protein N5853_08295 [Bartonella sp. HY329]UXN08439.1 hypothetical protein N5852_08305 [Bartonella sp. HY328]